MYKYLALILAIVAMTIYATITANPIQAQTVAPDQSNLATVQNSENLSQTAHGTFTKKRYSINGGWKIETIDGDTVLTFDERFKTKGGPDLKLYLSPNSLDTLSSQSAETGAIKLGVLKSNKGSQSYILPKNINLSEYKSLIIHCEAFSVLWGGFDLNP